MKIIINSKILEQLELQKLNFLHPMRRRSHRAAARTAPHVLSGLAEVSETVGQGQDDISPESIVPDFLMIVGGIGYRKVLRLVQDIVCLQ